MIYVMKNYFRLYLLSKVTKVYFFKNINQPWAWERDSVWNDGMSQPLETPGKTKAKKPWACPSVIQGCPAQVLFGLPIRGPFGTHLGTHFGCWWAHSGGMLLFNGTLSHLVQSYRVSLSLKISIILYLRSALSCHARSTLAELMPGGKYASYLRSTAAQQNPMCQ